MPNHSLIVQVGHLTRDPELKYAPSGTTIANFTLATNYGSGEKKEVCFIDIVLFGSVAELAEKYLQKGSAVLVEGRLTQDRWEDKKTGAKQSKHKIVGNRIMFLSNKQEQHGREPGDESELPF